MNRVLTSSRNALKSTGLALAWVAGTAAAMPSDADRAQFKLGPWKAQLVSEITPRLDRLTQPQPQDDIQWVNPKLLAPAFARDWLRETTPGWPSNQRVIRLAGFDQMGQKVTQEAMGPMTLVDSQRTRIEQSLLMPGVKTQVSRGTSWTVSAVLATQRFINPGMNLMAYRGTLPGKPNAGWWHGERVETSHGLGVRVAGEFQPVEAVAIEMGFRSHIDMNALANLQGVHGAQAQLDIPSRFEASLSWQLTERVATVLGASHIFYSEVGAFPSRAMPARFSGLLGDSTSPEFSWRDLTVLSAGVDIALSEQLTASIEYKNQAQPDPTSQALSQALGTVLNKHAWRVGVRQALGDRAQIHFGAAYAPPEYAFGGHILGVVSDQLDQSLEGQLLWQMWF